MIIDLLFLEECFDWAKLFLINNLFSNNMTQNTNEHWMRIAVQLATQGKGCTSPNPLVGCVIVDEQNNLVAEGYHRETGIDHAETVALAKAAQRAKGATLYVNLEPCSHYGKTPPCAKTIIECGIKKVIIGSLDPNPKVNGGGIQMLRAAGLEVITGVLEAECLELNKFFFYWIKTGLPYVCLKVAASLNSKIVNPQDRWVTGPEACKKVHQLRAEYDAILSGSGTVLVDDPELTVRLVQGRNPLRVILDRRLRCKPEHRLFKQAGETFLFTNQADRAETLKFLNTEIIGWSGNLNEVLQILGKRNVLSVLVEAGTELNTSFLENGLVNEVLYFMRPSIFAGRALADAFNVKKNRDFEIHHLENVGKDLMLALKSFD
jgi:diaminohydroxyphosphoribosylaminopyrimidine deaminase / 5-amino-6-(5-phosphoribosylamino)uracil reductase